MEFEVVVAADAAEPDLAAVRAAVAGPPLPRARGGRGGAGRLGGAQRWLAGRGGRADPLPGRRHAPRRRAAGRSAPARTRARARRRGRRARPRAVAAASAPGRARPLAGPRGPVRLPRPARRRGRGLGALLGRQPLPRARPARARRGLRRELPLRLRGARAGRPAAPGGPARRLRRRCPGRASPPAHAGGVARAHGGGGGRRAALRRGASRGRARTSTTCSPPPPPSRPAAAGARAWRPWCPSGSRGWDRGCGGRADLWFRQQLAPAFLAAWDQAGARADSAT